MKRKEFMEHAKLDNTWNQIYTFIHEGKEYHIATVLWQSLPWKLVSSTMFDDISDRDNKQHIIKEVYSQQDLWEYMRDNVLAV